MFSTLTGLPDWKKIGWHIGKRIHDILNPPKDDQPSKEELTSQRLADVLKGFTYLHTFDELEDWTPSSVDPLQLPNVPLVHREVVVDGTDQKANTILCHDFKGGYLDVEGIRASVVQDSFWCSEYLQSVELFIYFSHRLVSCPPPTWVNCLHRHGVKALGTFIIEPGTPEIERMLTHRNGTFLMAEHLGAMAKVLGFDGWLLNVEQELPENRTEQITEFIACLKSALGTSGCVLWYDALNIQNEVKYQNGLSELNLPFALVADGLFTNYKWNLQKLTRSKHVAGEHGVDVSKIYFGIDMWAQNNNGSGPPRITYPEKGGGGTNTGLALSTLGNYNLSAAIFAPGWTHEHFSPALQDEELKSVADDVNDSVWCGMPFPRYALCDCKGSPHHSGESQQVSILKSARLFTAGTKHCFYTNFGSAFSLVQSAASHQHQILPCLGLQSISPIQRGERHAHTLTLNYTYDQDTWGGDLASRTLVICARSTSQGIDKPNPTDPLQQLCLYKLAVSCAHRQRLTLKYRLDSSSFESQKLGLYVSFLLKGKETGVEFIPIPRASGIASSVDRDISVVNKEAVIGEIGIYHDGAIAQDDTEILRCYSLRIIPSSVAETRIECSIVNLQFVESSISSKIYKRLRWEWSSSSDDWPAEIPWSSVTGPFSHFSVYANGVAVGTAQTIAFPLSQAECEMITKSGEDGMIYTVEGHPFADLKLAEPAAATLRVVLSP